jgi:hypothetical protein
MEAFPSISVFLYCLRQSRPRTRSAYFAMEFSYSRVVCSSSIISSSAKGTRAACILPSSSCSATQATGVTSKAVTKVRFWPFSLPG